MSIQRLGRFVSKKLEKHKYNIGRFLALIALVGIAISAENLSQDMLYYFLICTHAFIFGFTNAVLYKAEKEEKKWKEELERTKKMNKCLEQGLYKLDCKIVKVEKDE